MELMGVNAIHLEEGTLLSSLSFLFVFICISALFSEDKSCQILK